MSEKRRRLCTEIQQLERQGELLSVSVARRVENIDGQLRRCLSPLGTVALGAAAGFIAERLTGGRSVGRLSGALISLLGGLGSSGVSILAGVAAKGGQKGTDAGGEAPGAGGVDAKRVPADADARI